MEKAIHELNAKCGNIKAHGEEKDCEKALNDIKSHYTTTKKDTRCGKEPGSESSTTKPGTSFAIFTKSSLVIIFTSLATYIFVC